MLRFEFGPRFEAIFLPPLLLVVLCVLAPALSGQTAGNAPIARERGALEIFSTTQLREGPMRLARGDVELRYNSIVLTADEMDFNEETGEVEARGNVRYRAGGGREDIRAARMSYNTRTEAGTFYDVRGRVSSASQGGARILTTDNPFLIEAPVAHKTKEHYRVHNGRVTNCETESPWWTLRSPHTTIVPGKQAAVRRGVLRMRGVPILYLPYFKKSLERMPRKSGFLTPNIGNSSRFGRMLGQAYYWAINRSYDMTVGGNWYTDRGLASNLSFRGRPTKNSSFDAVFFDVRDRGRKLDDGSRLKQGGNSFDLRGRTRFGRGFRGVADLRYLSSLEFRQAFTQTFEEAVFSQVRSIGFVTNNFSTFSFNASLLRNENFQSVDRGDTIVLRRLPSFEFNSRDRRLTKGKVPLWLSFDSSFDLVSRTQRSFQSRRFVQRGEFFPRVSTKLFWKGFHVTPTLGARAAAYGQSRRQDRLAGENLYRRTGELAVDIAAPSLSRIYRAPKWMGDRMKHVIEPRLRYRYTAGIDDFERVIRFDSRDLIHNTNEAEVSITNRLYVKDDASGQVREAAVLEVWQRRYFDADFGGALVPGRRNVLRSSLDFSPFSFLAEPRRYSPVAVSFKVNPHWRYALSWRNDYDPLRGRIVNTTTDVSVQISPKIGVTAGHRAVRAPTALSPASNQLLATVRYGDFNRRGWNVALTNVYDYRRHLFLYSISQITYNTDCCGFSLEYRRLAIGRTRNDNQFRIGISIANVGSFGTLRPAERLF